MLRKLNEIKYDCFGDRRENKCRNYGQSSVRVLWNTTTVSKFTSGGKRGKKLPPDDFYSGMIFQQRKRAVKKMNMGR